MDEFDYDGVRHGLMSEKLTQRKAARAVAEKLFTQHLSSTVSASNTMGLMYAVVEYELKEMRIAAEKGREVGLEVAQFFKQTMKFCIQHGRIRSSKLIPVIDHVSQLVGDKTLGGSFKQIHKSVLLDLLVPKLTHSMELQRESQLSPSGLAAVFACVKSVFSDPRARKDPLNQRLLRNMFQCAFSDIPVETHGASIASWLKESIQAESVHDSDGSSLLLAYAECCVILLRYQGVNLLTHMVPLVHALLFKLSVRIQVDTWKEPHVLVIAQLARVLHELFREGAVGVDALFADVQNDLHAPLSDFAGALLSPSFIQQLVLAADKKSSRSKAKDGAPMDEGTALLWNAISRVVAWSSSQTGTSLPSHGDGIPPPAKRAKVPSAGSQVARCNLWDRLADAVRQATEAKGMSEIEFKNRVALVRGYYWLLTAMLNWELSSGAKCVEDWFTSGREDYTDRRLSCIYLLLQGLYSQWIRLVPALCDASVMEAAIGAFSAVLGLPLPPLAHHASRCELRDVIVAFLTAVVTYSVDQFGKETREWSPAIDLAATTLVHPALNHSSVRSTCALLFEKWSWLVDAYSGQAAMPACTLRLVSVTVHLGVFPEGLKEQVQHQPTALLSSKSYWRFRTLLAVRWSLDTALRVKVDDRRAGGLKDDVDLIRRFIAGPLPSSAIARGSCASLRDELPWLDDEAVLMPQTELPAAACNRSAPMPVTAGDWMSISDVIAQAMQDLRGLQKIDLESQAGAAVCLLAVLCSLLGLSDSGGADSPPSYHIYGDATELCALVLENAENLARQRAHSATWNILNALEACLMTQTPLTLSRLFPVDCRPRKRLASLVLTLFEFVATGSPGVFEARSLDIEADRMDDAWNESARDDFAALPKSWTLDDEGNAKVIARSVGVLAALAADMSLDLLVTLEAAKVSGMLHAVPSERLLDLAVSLSRCGDVGLVRWLVEAASGLWRPMWGKLGYCQLLLSTLGLLESEGSWTRSLAASFDPTEETSQFVWSMVMPGDEELKGFIASLWLLRAYQLRCLGILLTKCGDITAIKDSVARTFTQGMQDTDARVRLVASQHAHCILPHFKNPLKVYESLTESSGAYERCYLGPLLVAHAQFGTSQRHRAMLWRLTMLRGMQLCAAAALPSVSYQATLRWFKRRMTAHVRPQHASGLLLLHLDWLLHEWLLNDDGPPASSALRRFPFFLFEFDSHRCDDDGFFICRYASRIVPVVASVGDPSSRWRLLLELCSALRQSTSDAAVALLVRSHLQHIKAAEFSLFFLSRQCGDEDFRERASQISQFVERIAANADVISYVRTHITTVVCMLLRALLAHADDTVVVADDGSFISIENPVAEGSLQLADYLDEVARVLKFPTATDMLGACNLVEVLVCVRDAVESGASVACTVVAMSIVCTLLPHWAPVPLLSRLALATIECAMVAHRTASQAVVSMLPMLVAQLTKSISTPAGLSEVGMAVSDITAWLWVYSRAAASTSTDRWTGVVGGAIEQLADCPVTERASAAVNAITPWIGAADDALGQEFGEDCRNYFCAPGACGNSDSKSLADRLSVLTVTCERYRSGCGFSWVTIWIQMHALSAELARTAHAASDEDQQTYCRVSPLVMSTVQVIAERFSAPQDSELLRLLADVMVQFEVSRSAGQTSILQSTFPLSVVSKDEHDLHAAGLWAQVFREVIAGGLQARHRLLLCALSLKPVNGTATLGSVCPEFVAQSSLAPTDRCLVLALLEEYAKDGALEMLPQSAALFDCVHALPHQAVAADLSGAWAQHAMDIASKHAWDADIWRSVGAFTANHICQLAFHVLAFHLRPASPIIAPTIAPVDALLEYAQELCLTDERVAERVLTIALSRIVNGPPRVDLSMVLDRLVDGLCKSPHRRSQQAGHRLVTFLLQMLSHNWSTLHQTLLTLGDPLPVEASPATSALRQLLARSDRLADVARTAMACRDGCSAYRLVELVAECGRARVTNKGMEWMDLARTLMAELIQTDCVIDSGELHELAFGSDLKLQALLHANSGAYDRALLAYESAIAAGDSAVGCYDGMLNCLYGLGAATVSSVYMKHATAGRASARTELGKWTVDVIPSGETRSLRYSAQSLRSELLEDLVCSARGANATESVKDYARSVQAILRGRLQLQLQACESLDAAALRGMVLLPVAPRLSVLRSLLDDADGDPGKVFSLLQFVNDAAMDLEDGPAHRLAPQLHSMWRCAESVVERNDGALPPAQRTLVLAQIHFQEAASLWKKGFKDTALVRMDATTIVQLRQCVGELGQTVELSVLSRALLSDALRLTGHWMSQKGYHSKAEVVDGFLLPALELAQSVARDASGPAVAALGSAWSLHLRVDPAASRREATCHLAIASFFELRFHTLHARLSSREWEQRQSNLAERRVEFDECMRLHDQCATEIAALDQRIRAGSSGLTAARAEQDRARKNTCRHLLTLKREILMDERERDDLLQMRHEGMLSAVRHYCAVLELSPTAGALALDGGQVDMVFRLVNLWLSNAGDGLLDAALLEVSRFMTDKLRARRLPLHPFLLLHQQLLSRLGVSSGRESIEARRGLQEGLTVLAEALGCAFPFHVLPSLFALLHNNVDAASATQAASVESSLAALAVASLAVEALDTRQQVAAQTLRAVARHFLAQAPALQLVTAMQLVLQQYIVLAKAPTQDLQQRGRTKQLRFSDLQPRGTRFHERLLVAVSMCPLPVLTAPLRAVPYGHPLHASAAVMAMNFADKFDITENGISRPKIVTCLGSDGRVYRQVVKGGDDLRQDAVMQQVFGAVNAALQRRNWSGEGGGVKGERWAQELRVRTYKVLPTSAQTGLLEFVEDTLPFGSILCDAARAGTTPRALHGRHRPGDWTHVQCRDALRACTDAAAKLRAYERICAHFQPVFRFFFLEQFPCASRWCVSRSNYVDSVAVNSMIGYVLGIGDRHAHNLLVDVQTAEVVHIDFGIVFEQGQLLTVPETVPFRLTRDMEDGMGVLGTQGRFRRRCELSLSALQALRDQLMVILEVVLFDPLYKWSLPPLLARGRQLEDPDDPALPPAAAVDGPPPSRDAAQRALARVRAKLDGLEAQAGAAPGHGALAAEDVVALTIRAARDPANLSRLFPGWSPWM